MSSRIILAMLAMMSIAVNVPIYTAGDEDIKEDFVQEVASEAVISERAPEAPSVAQAEAAVREGKAAVKAAVAREKAERKRVRAQEEEKKEYEEGEVKEDAYTTVGSDEGAAIQGDAAPEVVDSDVRTLLVFLDNSEIVRADQMGAFTRKAAVALYQKAGPLLISSSLLAHIFNFFGNHDEFTRRVLQVFYEKFDATEWAVYRDTYKTKDGNDEYGDFLLVPLRNPVIKTTIEDFNVDGLEKIDTTTKDSLHTYFDTSKNIAGKQITEYDHAQALAENKEFLANYPEQFIRFFKYLFLPKNRKHNNDYTGRRVDAASRWVICLGGHGEYGVSIAGLSIADDKPQFQQLLDFLNKKIKTKLFVYDSCYAAGFNAQQVYDELMKFGSVRTYPFAIVTGATTDVPTISGYIQAEYGDSGMDIKSEVEYDRFVEQVTKEPINYPLALGYIFPLIKRSINTMNELGSFPQIRPPYVAAWLPVVDVNKAVIRIGTVMAAAREETKEPLVIRQYKDVNGDMQDPRVVLLAIEKVDFPIIIDSEIDEIPSFISLLPGRAKHELSSLTFKGRRFDISQFVGAADYEDIKTIEIGELTTGEEWPGSVFKNVNIKIKKDLVEATGVDKEGITRDLR